MKMHLNFQIELEDEKMNYLRSCAKIRHMSPTRLASRLIQAICDDQLVLSVLDDDSKPGPLAPGEKHRWAYLE